GERCGRLVRALQCRDVDRVDPLVLQAIGEQLGLAAPHRVELGIAVAVHRAKRTVGMHRRRLAVPHEQDRRGSGRRAVAMLAVARGGRRGTSGIFGISPHTRQARLPGVNMAERASSFGGVASHYERYRPGPPMAAVDWLLPSRPSRVVDLGAGTGALTRLLVERADEVVAVEPDDRMRAVLAEQVPGARAVEGRGEAIPLPDGVADAVFASSSWHWMDPVATLTEVARVLVPGGTLGAMWTGPDDDGAFMVEAR